MYACVRDVAVCPGDAARLEKHEIIGRQGCVLRPDIDVQVGRLRNEIRNPHRYDMLLERRPLGSGLEQLKQLPMGKRTLPYGDVIHAAGEPILVLRAVLPKCCMLTRLYHLGQAHATATTPGVYVLELAVQVNGSLSGHRTDIPIVEADNMMPLPRRKM